MSTEQANWREMCRELVDELHGYASANPHHDSDALVARARAALAEPVAEGPTDEELLGLDELEESWNAQADAANSWDELGIDEIIVWAQRQALARWSRPAPPAEGEVAELVAWLRGCADDHCGHGRRQLTRAADLLEQRHPAPVPVAERLPGPGDCDAEGRVWLYRPQTPILNPYWDLVKLDYIDPVPPTHWLPAHALPLPAGEVE